MKYRVKPVSGTEVQTLVGSKKNIKQVPVEVVNSKKGVLGPFDKIKAYYKFILTGIGLILIVLNQATPIFEHNNTFTYIVGAVTAISVFLKENEHWVDDL